MYTTHFAELCQSIPHISVVSPTNMTDGSLPAGCQLGNVLHIHSLSSLTTPMVTGLQQTPVSLSFLTKQIHWTGRQVICLPHTSLLAYVAYHNTLGAYIQINCVYGIEFNLSQHIQIVETRVTAGILCYGGKSTLEVLYPCLYNAGRGSEQLYLVVRLSSL